MAPDNARGLGNLGAALLERKDVAGALAQFDRLAQLQPGNASNHSNRGRALLRLGQLDEAEEAYKLALQLNPETETERAVKGLYDVAAERFVQNIGVMGGGVMVYGVRVAARERLSQENAPK